MIDFSSKRFLIVDDQAGMRSALRTILSAFGVIHADMATSANDVVRRLQSRSYDVIVCDYLLGEGADGQQLLEQLRHNRLISLQTVFVMVTAERTYERVVSAVELAPDDYLVKPFTAETLRTRLVRVFEKKAAFAPIHALIETGDLAEAIRVCSQAVAAGGKYTLDFLRLLAELYVSQGEFGEAEKIYQRVMEMRAIPWARMGLARMLHAQGRSEEAEVLLLQVVEEAPEYMAAHDELASVLEANGKTREAQAVLSRAAAASPYILTRQRQVGELALRNDDLAAAEQAFRTVVERGRTSFFRQPDDYARLSRVQLKQGRIDEALATVRELRKNFNDTPETEFTAAVMESLIHGQAGDATRATQALEVALELQRRGLAGLTEEATLSLAEACLRQGREEVARELVEHAVKSNHESRSLIEKAKRIYAEAGRAAEGAALVEGSVQAIIQLNNEGVRRAQKGDLEGAVQLLSEAADRLPNNVQIVLNAAQAALVLMDRRGFDEARMEKVRHYLALVRAREPHHAKLRVIESLADDVAHKYGVAR